MSGEGVNSGLDERSAEVLRAIIREHVISGEPIGSKRVAQGGRLSLSPATIRSVMAQLESQGLLAQPHTSAGRVPTDKAYRVYVDRMIEKPRMSPTQAQAIDMALDESGGEVDDLLEAASRQLSRMSKQVGVVLAPELQRIVVTRLEFVRLDAGRVVAILVGSSGLVHNRILEVSEPREQQELDRIGRYLSTEFGGRTLPEMRELLQKRVGEERAAYDKLMARSLELGRQAVESDDDSTEVFVEGTSNLVRIPEFADLERMRSLLRTLEEKRTLIRILGRVLDGSGVRVVIGEENPMADLAGCSLVAASYGTGGRSLGTLGIVGPTRMEYARAIALVDYLAKVLTRRLTPGN